MACGVKLASNLSHQAAAAPLGGAPSIPAMPATPVVPGRRHSWGSHAAIPAAVPLSKWSSTRWPCPGCPGRRYSWGSCLAAHGLSHPAVAAYVGVSPPLGGMAWVLQTKKHFAEVCRAIHLPRLLLLGDQVRFERWTLAAIMESYLLSSERLRLPYERPCTPLTTHAPCPATQ